MSNPPYKLSEVHDLFSPDRIATFERPKADHETVIIRVPGAPDFHLTANSLKIIGQVMAFNPKS